MNRVAIPSDSGQVSTLKKGGVGMSEEKEVKVAIPSDSGQVSTNELE